MPAQGGTTERGYGSDHQKLREYWRPVVEGGDGQCCATACLDPDGTGRWIAPDAPWDLGHTEDRSAYTGPEHRSCNRSDGGRRRHTPAPPPELTNAGTPSQDWWA